MEFIITLDYRQLGADLFMIAKRHFDSIQTRPQWQSVDRLWLQRSISDLLTRAAIECETFPMLVGAADLREPRAFCPDLLVDSSLAIFIHPGHIDTMDYFDELSALCKGCHGLEAAYMFAFSEAAHFYPLI